MEGNESLEARVDQLVAWYGDGADGTVPSREQWRRIVRRPAGESVVLVNFFKLRDRAKYPEEAADTEPGSGRQAFDRYAAVSMPALSRVGGKFLLVAPVEAMFLGEDEDWDLVAIGSYPDNTSLLALFEDADYRAAFLHRTAACARQKVAVCSGRGHDARG